MALVYADYCKICHEHKTRNASGICYLCARKTRKVLCSKCGTSYTANVSGICYRCTKENTPEQGRPENVVSLAIERLKDDIKILELRQKGVSFQNIAKRLGIPVEEAYARFIYRFNSKISSGEIDYVDGKYILSYGEKAIIESTNKQRQEKLEEKVKDDVQAVENAQAEENLVEVDEKDKKWRFNITTGFERK